MKGERGMSLVEATIILTVLAVLATALAPSIGAYIQDGRNAVAKKDVEAIGAAIAQLLRDTGSRCLRLSGTTDCAVTNRVDLLVSGGNEPLAVNAADITLPDAEAGAPALGGVVNWLPDDSAPPISQRDTLDDQLVENDNGVPYSAVAFTGGGGPRMKLGWRGPYLSGPVTGDPWGRMYQANTLFLTVATNAADTGGSQSQEGLREAGWNRDVLVLSAGGDGIVDTSFGGDATGGVTAGGDDVVYVLGGSTR
jgi:type II secretory pathway pseudopilin PulG